MNIKHFSKHCSIHHVVVWEKNNCVQLSHNNTLTNAKKETLLTHQIALLFWMNSCSYFEANPAFIQPVFFQKTNSNVSARNDLALLLGVSLSTRHTWYLHMNTRGRDRIRNNELDGTDWTSCWFHTDYFITECLFSIRLTSFQSRHFQLSIDITPMSVCVSFRWVTVHFSDVFWRAARGDGRKTRAHPVCFFFFSKTTKFLLYSWVYTKKNRHFKFSIDV